MPNNATWPGGAMEALSSRDSAGSCDSVISMNSACSEDSMEQLPPDVQASLTFLEETIKALKVQEDSGLCSDEPDPGAPAQGNSTFRSGSAEDQISEPQYFTANGHDANSASLDLVSRLSRPLSESDTGSKTTSSATQTKMLYVSTDIDGKPKIITSDKIGQGRSTEASGVDLGLIPPPSDFMDEPDSPAGPQNVDRHPSLEISTNQPAGAVDLEAVRQRASVKGASLSVTKPRPEVSLSLSQASVTSGVQMNHSPEAAEPKARPLVAPKPKKLPANIILKSQKGSAPSEGISGHSGAASSDRVSLDPQRVRIEALRKLGLLKSEEADVGASPKHSPKTRKSWSAPSPELNPVTPPLTPSSAPVSCTPPAPASPSPAAVLPSGPSTGPPAQLLPDILPAPAAFSDYDKPPVYENSLSPVKDVLEADVNVNAAVNTPPLTPPALTKQLTPPRVTGVKSVTLERSGLGLSSYMAAQDSSESSQGGGEHPSRPRPASLRSRKEGEGLEKRSASSKEPGSQRSLSAQASRDSQKLPRSQGISVLICPRAENEEDRRNALKKLGLLRD